MYDWGKVHTYGNKAIIVQFGSLIPNYFKPKHYNDFEPKVGPNKTEQERIEPKHN